VSDTTADTADTAVQKTASETESKVGSKAASQTVSPWAIKDYRWWFAGDTTLTIGSGIGGFAFTLLAYPITHSVALAGIVGAAETIASAPTLIVGGMLADRFDRKKLMYWSAGTGIAVMALLIAFYAAGWMNFASLVAFALIRGFTSGLFGGITNTVLPQIVSGGALTSAMGANQSRDAVIQILSSPLSGLLYGFAPEAPFAFAVLMYLIFGATIPPIHADLRPTSGSAQKGVEEDRESRSVPLSEAFRWFGKAKVVVQLMFTVLAINFGLSLLTTTFTLDQQRIGTSTTMIGLIDSAVGVGTILGSFTTRWASKRFSGGTIIRWAALWIAIVFAAVALTENPWVICAICFIAALPLIPCNAIGGSYETLLIPNHLRGRVEAVMGVLAVCLSSLASVVAGSLLQAIGYQWTIALAAFVLLVGALIAFFGKPIRQIPFRKDFDAITPIAVE
jgi:MFS family permease